MTGPGFEFGAGDYLSPFTWRYGSEAMRRIWSEAEKRRLWRRIWVALAAAQAEAGLVRPEQVAELAAHQDEIDIPAALALEAELRHDLMAELRIFARQSPGAAGVIHLGATSMDIEDNADALRLRAALDLLAARLDELLVALATAIERLADLATMAFTHLQPAEPTTMGYRLALYAQDLLADRDQLAFERAALRGKGFKGAAGTSASYAQLLAGTAMTPAELERRVMERLDLAAVPVAGQTYPRKQDYRIVAALAALAQSLHKFSADLRILQSPPFGEWAEPFGPRQVGSSAMPFKRNPIAAENICSLARLIAALPRVAWDNAAHSWLERTLDDSASRRSLLPEACLAADEILGRAVKIVAGLRVDEAAAARQLERYGTFAASERLLMEASRRGGDRQELHEVIREHSLAAWEAIRAGRPSPLADSLAGDERVTRHLPAAEVRACLDARGYLGDAPERARALAARVRAALAGSSPPDPRR